MWHYLRERTTFSGNEHTISCAMTQLRWPRARGLARYTAKKARTKNNSKTIYNRAETFGRTGVSGVSMISTITAILCNWDAYFEWLNISKMTANHWFSGDLLEEAIVLISYVWEFETSMSLKNKHFCTSVICNPHIFVSCYIALPLWSKL